MLINFGSVQFSNRGGVIYKTKSYLLLHFEQKTEVNRVKHNNTKYM